VTSHDRLLEGLTVLDTTRFLAGPYGAMMLGDMGADVIKVEAPDGDFTRTIPPYSIGDDSVYFVSANRNKRSVVLDLHSEDGREAFSYLARSADVVLDNLRPRQRTALGLSHEQLAAINPGIISASVTGFGSEGPYAERPGVDIVVQAMSGVMGLTGEPGGATYRAGVPIADLVGGIYMVVGVLGAIYNRVRTGLGQHIDISLLDGQVSLLSYLASYYLFSGVVPKAQGRTHESIPTINTFTAADAIEVVVATNSEPMWRALCAAIGQDNLATDPRFNSGSQRLRHRDELIPLLEAAFLTKNAEDVVAELTSRGVAATTIATLADVFANPQVLHRDMLIEYAHRSGERVRSVGNPIKASRSSVPTWQSPPGHGEHTREILHAAGTPPHLLDRVCGDRDPAETPRR
jgi:CoA:oxalate CoA-transferase